MCGPLKIALSMRVVTAAGYHERRDALSQDWIPLLESWGAIPVCLPNTYSNIESLLDMVDLVILTGGNDITLSPDGEDLVDAEEHAKERDLQEYRIIDLCIQKGIPLLGVCRGMQIINYKFGGALELVEKERHVANRHAVRIADSEYKNLLGEVEVVNSYHNYGITRNTLGAGLEVLATSSDGVIEAVAHDQYPIVGIMWHPERNDNYTTYDKNLIMELVNSIKTGE